MRGLKVAVALLAGWTVVLTLFTLTLHREFQKTSESLDGLTALLEIHKWELPMPKDARYEWSFEVRDYKSSNVVEKGLTDWMDASRKAKIVFMPLGEGNVYHFWFVQPGGTSSGSTRLDVCDDPDNIQHNCDVGQFETNWLKEPKRIEDGQTYLICEINETFPPLRRKQVLLHLSLFRLEDIQKNYEKSLSIPQFERKPSSPKS
jgi:hypothetical protein